MNTTEITAQVIDALNKHQISYMAVGSTASNFHSVPRATKDADIVIETALGSAATLIAESCPSLRLDPQISFETVTGTRKLVLSAVSDDFDVELFALSDDAHDQCRFQNKKLVDWEGRSLWIASLEDTLVMKLRWGHLAHRRKDLADASTIIAIQADAIDWPYVEGWCDRHGSRALLEQIRAELRDR